MWKVVTVCCLIGLVQSNKRQFPQSPTYPSAVSFADRVDFYDNVDVPVPYYNKILDPRLVPYPYVTNHGYGINHRGYAIHPPFASGYNYVIQNKYDAPNVNKNMNNLKNREYIPRINGQGPENILNSDRFPKINFNRGDGQASSRKDMLN